MQMPFNEQKAIDETIKVIDGLTKFYENVTNIHRATIKIEDLYFVLAEDGKVYLEYNSESRYYKSEMCNVKHCHLTEEEICQKIALFFDNIVG